MSKAQVMVFLCAGKDCTRRWQKLGHGSPRKWLKHRAEEAGLPYKLKVVETECMDRCDQAACLCLVHGTSASLETDVRSEEDADRVLAALRACVERATPTGSI